MRKGRRTQTEADLFGVEIRALFVGLTSKVHPHPFIWGLC